MRKRAARGLSYLLVGLLSVALMAQVLMASTYPLEVVQAALSAPSSS
jgi:Protein of unknown function (DUF3300)